MQKFVEADPDLSALFEEKAADWVLASNPIKIGSPSASRAHHHGDFDDDKETLVATLARILGNSPAGLDVRVQSSANSVRSMRVQLVRTTGQPTVV